jgi:hypothetical protein
MSKAAQADALNKAHQIETIIENELGEASSSNGVFSLPCGYLDDNDVLHTEVALRAMRGDEEDLLSSRKISFDKKMNQLLVSCVDRIGPVTNKGEIAKIVPRLIIGDRTFLFFAIRRVSLGDVFPFKETCPNCNEEKIYPFDLNALDVVPMKDPEKRVHEVQLPDSQSVARVKHMTGADEEERDRRKAQIPPLTLLLMLRVVDIDGKPPSIFTLKNLTVRDRDTIRAAFVALDGGIETTIDVQCPLCGCEFKREIDPGQPSFFSPSETQALWKRKSST